jgi:amino acid transporter
MIYLGVLLGLGLMAAMISMALNKKSNFAVRIASLGALALMVLTIIICLFIIFTDDRVVIDESVLIVGAPVEIQQAESGNVTIVLLLIIILLALFGVVVFQAMKEQRKNIPKKTEKPLSSW